VERAGKWRSKAAVDYSISFVPSRIRSATRVAPLFPLLAGALLLAIAEFLPLLEIRAITAVIGEQSTGSHHGYAQLVVAAVLVPMSVGAVVGGSRPAALAALALAVIALFIALAVDLPHVNETGILGETYERAEASPKIGFHLETLGAALALIGAVATLALRGARTPEPRRRPTAAAAEPEVA
jgi:hypothetical protein